MIRVTLQDGKTYVDFADNTPPEKIKEVMAKKFYRAGPEIMQGAKTEQRRTEPLEEPFKPVKTPLGMALTAIGMPKERLVKAMSSSENPLYAKMGETLGNMVPYEITPQEATLGMVGSYVGKRAVGFENAPGKFSNLFDRIQRAEISDAEMRLMKKTSSNTYLSDLIEHPVLFNKYPELKDIVVRFNEGSGASLVTTKKGIKYIRLGKDVSEDDLPYTLIHEIQHWIQEKEGFSEGKNIIKSGPEAYTKSAGEIEARDVEARMALGSEKRLHTLPYTSEYFGLKEWIK